MSETTDKQASSRREWWIVLTLLAASVLVRWLLSSADRVIWGDEPFYLWLGRNWLTGRGYSFTGYTDVHHTPMYPLLTGLLYLVTRDMALSSRICYILFGAGLSLPLYGIAREIYDRRAGHVVMALAAVYPALTAAVLFWGTMTEPPYYFFIYAGVYFALRAMRDHRVPWTSFLAGLCLGLAYLTRPEAIAHVLAIGAVLVITRLWERRLLTSKTLAHLGLYALGMLLILLPYAYYTYLHTGSWMVSEKAGVTFVTCIGLSSGDTAAFDRATWGLDQTGLEVFFFSRESYNVSMLDYVLAYPQVFGNLVIQNIITFANSVISLRLFPYFFLPFLGLALFRVPWDIKRTKAELLMLASALPVLGFLAFFIQDRYIATLLPTLLIWLAVGLRDMGDWLRDTAVATLKVKRAAWVNWLYLVPTALVLAFCLVMLPRTMANTSRGSFREAHRTVGEWLASQDVDEDAVIMSRYPALAFHAGTRWVPTPNASYKEIMAYARHKNADYFLVDERETVELRPQLAPLAHGEDVPPELELLHLDASEPETLAVYRIKDGS